MDEKVYYPQTIEDLPFPQEGVEDLGVSQSTSRDTYANPTIKDQSFPEKRQAVELLSTALNTRSRKILGEFGFTPSGAIQIGQYENGISGDVRISPNGILARNRSGLNTFALDGDTGDAIFAGQLRSGSIITGEVVLGDSSIILNGEERRILVHDGTTYRIVIGEV